MKIKKLFIVGESKDGMCGVMKPSNCIKMYEITFLCRWEEKPLTTVSLEMGGDCKTNANGNVPKLCTLVDKAVTHFLGLFFQMPRGETEIFNRNYYVMSSLFL